MRDHETVSGLLSRGSVVRIHLGAPYLRPIRDRRNRPGGNGAGMILALALLSGCALSAPVPEPSACSPSPDAGVVAPPSYRYTLIQDRQEYATAEATCVSLGGHLARPHGGDPVAAVQTLTDACPADVPCWIGLTYARDGRAYGWSISSYGPAWDAIPLDVGYPSPGQRYYPLCEIAE